MSKRLRHYLSARATVPVLLVLLLLGTGFAHAQTVIPRLVCKGEMPDDFRLKYSEKYRNTLNTTDDFKGRRSKKKKREFAALTNIAIDNLFRSGKVLYGDEVTVYCNKLLDVLLDDNPELRRELRIYTLRSNQVNAFSTHQGIILVTTGLVARMETEAELAFVLAHEVAHYVKKHNFEGYQYNKELFENDVKNRKSSLDDKLLESARYSRESETEADDYGWDLFVKAGYDPKEVLHAHDILLHAYLPMENRTFPYNLVEDSLFRIRDSYKEYERKEIEPEEDIDDSESTHPNIHQRKRAATVKMSQPDFVPGDKVFILNREEFAEVVKLAKMDVIYNFVIHSRYVEALMLCDAWMGSSELDAGYLKTTRAMCLYGIQFLTNEKRKLFPSRDEAREGDQESYYFLFRSLTREETNILVTRELWKAYRMDTANVFMERVFRHSLTQTKKITRKIEFDPTGLDSNDIRERSRECFTCDRAFDSEEFAGLRALLEKQDDETRVAERREENKREKQLKATASGSDKGLERMVLFSPQYFGMDMRKSIDKRFLMAEKNHQFLEDITLEYSKELGIEVVMPDSRNARNSMTDDFNNYATLVDWMIESAGEEESYQSFLGQDIQRIRKEYNADYLTLTFCWNLIERKKFSAPLALMSGLIIYALPVYLYWQLTPYSSIAYAFLVVDMKDGTAKYLEVKEMNTRYRKYLIKAHVYNSINQIRK